MSPRSMADDASETPPTDGAADSASPSRVPRVLDLSTPRAPGEPAPEPEPEAPALPTLRGPVPVAGRTVDLSTGRAPSAPSRPKPSAPSASAIVVRQTVNLSTKKVEPTAEAAPEAKRARGGAPQGAQTAGSGSRSGGKRGAKRGGQSRGGGRRPDAPKPSGTGLADFLDPETLRKLRGE